MKFVLIMLLILLGAADVFAAEKAPAPAFFEALYDVPIMPGLSELPDEAVLFDKPGGRIASVMAVSTHAGNGGILEFYASTLPQLGWQKINQNQYVRGNDRLSFDIVSEPPQKFVQITLSPRAP